MLKTNERNVFYLTEKTNIIMNDYLKRFVDLDCIKLIALLKFFNFESCFFNSETDIMIINFFGKIQKASNLEVFFRRRFKLMYFFLSFL